MNKGRVILTGIALIVVYVVLECLVHGDFLKNIYMQTSSVWRPQAEMKQLFWYMLLGEVIFAYMFAVIFAKGYERGKPGLGQGLRYGLLMALLLGPPMGLIWYAVLPIPGMLAVYWALATFVEMLILGLVAGLIYKP